MRQLLETQNLLTSKPRQWPGWFVSIECKCRGGRMFNIQTMCQERPTLKEQTIGAIAAKLRCQRCDTIPHVVELWSNQDVVGAYPDDAIKIRIIAIPGGPP